MLAATWQNQIFLAMLPLSPKYWSINSDNCSWTSVFLWYISWEVPSHHWGEKEKRVMDTNKEQLYHTFSKCSATRHPCVTVLSVRMASNEWLPGLFNEDAAQDYLLSFVALKGITNHHQRMLRRGLMGELEWVDSIVWCF